MGMDEKEKIETAGEAEETKSCAKHGNENQKECDDDFLSVFVSM